MAQNCYQGKRQLSILLDILLFCRPVLAGASSTTGPQKKYALWPLDVFPEGLMDPIDWRNLVFGNWWSWLEKWGKLATTPRPLLTLQRWPMDHHVPPFCLAVLRAWSQSKPPVWIRAGEKHVFDASLPKMVTDQAALPWGRPTGPEFLNRIGPCPTNIWP